MPLHTKARLDSKLTVPNVLTAMRIVMAVVAAWLFTAGVAEKTAVILCAIAALLDAFDGWYARTFSQCSKLGEHLDPLADKLLMAVVFGVMAIKINSSVVWVLVVMIALREVGMTLFRSYSLRRHQRFIPANRLGKTKMIVQSTVGIGIIMYAHFWSGWTEVSAMLVIPALAAILVLSYLSAVVYIRSWNAAKPRPIAQMDAPLSAKFEDSRMVVGK